MKKVKFLQILLVVILALSFVLLTGEIFGTLRPLLVRVYDIAMWVASAGIAVCAVVLHVKSKKNK